MQAHASSSSADPTPIAVEFIRDYRPPRGNQVPAELQNREKELFPEASVGEQGWAHRQWKLTTPNGPVLLAWVVVIAGGRARRGWVPTSNLARGERRRENLPIELPEEQLQPLPPVPGVTHQNRNTVLYRTIQGFWQMIRDNRDTVVAPVANQDETGLIEQTLYGQGADSYVDLLYSSIVPEVRKVLDSGRFSARDFLNPANRIRHVTTSGPGSEFAIIYAMITEEVTHPISKFVQGASSVTAFYIGQSSNGPDRCLTAGRSHKFLLEHPDHQAGKALKYQIARTGRNTVWIPILCIRKSDPNVQKIQWKNFLHIAELTFVALIKSWNPLLARSTNVQEMGSYARDYEAASIFRKLIDEVATKTGWRPDPVLGTNWTTPIFSAMPEDRAWISWYNTERQAYLFRSRCTIYADQRSKTGKKASLCVRVAGCRVTLPAALQNTGQLKQGDGVHLLFELSCDQAMQKFRTNSAPYFRTPGISANDEYERIASLGLRYQWVDPISGQWKESIAQRVKVVEDGIPTALRSGMVVLAMLTRTIYINGPTGQVPDWLHSTSRNTVKLIKYNHLEQRQVLEEVPQKTKLWRRDYTVADNRNRLHQYILHKNSDTVLDDRTQIAGGSSRENCDFCLSMLSTDKCLYDAATQSCRRCRAFNRPCTWTYRGDGSANTTDALGRPNKPNTVDMLALGRSLEELGIPTNIHSAAIKEKQPQQLVRNIDPPFALELEMDVASEQKDTPLPQPGQEGGDSGQ